MLASARLPWQGKPMDPNNSSRQNSLGPGCLIIAPCLIGAVLGMRYYHSASLGIVIGFAIGVVLAVVFVLLPRGR